MGKYESSINEFQKELRTNIVIKRERYMVSPTLVDIGLFAIVLIVLVGPFMVKKIEHNLEAFLFVMGVLAVTIAGFESRAVLEAIGYNH